MGDEGLGCDLHRGFHVGYVMCVNLLSLGCVVCEAEGKEYYRLFSREANTTKSSLTVETNCVWLRMWP